MRDGRAIVFSDYVGGDNAASGGAGHAAYDSYRALRDAGIDVRVVAGFGARPVHDGDHFTWLGGRDLRAGGLLDAARAIYNWDARRALAAELEKEDLDRTIVILHQWTRWLTPAALGLLDNACTMIYMHDYFWACPNGAYYDFQQHRPCDRQPLGARCLMANCDRGGVVPKAWRVLRQTVREVAVRAPPERRLFLHMAENTLRTAGSLLPLERHAVVHNPLGMPAEQPVVTRRPLYDVGYFGRLEPEKGIRVLIDAADRMGLTGLFVGQGALEKKLSRCTRFEHRPWAPRSAMAIAMRSCRVVVLPSLWPETWGLIIPEAMAAGVMVLVSSRAGSSDMVKRFGGGAIFDPGVPGDLELKLAQLLRQHGAPKLDRPSFRQVLSPENHARQIARLAAENFGVRLIKVGSASSLDQTVQM